VGSLKATLRKLRANEERMIRAERLAISGELTASVIHEIKNPLVSIGGFARNLASSEHLSADDREKLRIILNESMRLEAFLENLQSRVIILKLEEGDINQILENNCELLHNEMSERDITLQKSLTPGIPNCMLDVVRIHEVFLNILQNSIEAVGQKGIISVKTWLERGMVHIEIADNGGGISHDEMNMIFTPFFTTKVNGSGLGLTLAHAIVRDHGGTISVKSARGEGAVFHVSLPAVKVKSTV
jgi:signal transduction histidine kinase